MIRILEWEVVPETCTLSRIATDDESHLSPRGMEVLVFLAENPGKVVSAQELLDRFWSKSVTSDHAVHNAIAEIRAALGDSASNSRYIKTFPKRGYSLIVEPTTSSVPATIRAASFNVASFMAKHRLAAAFLLLVGVVAVVGRTWLVRDAIDTVVPASSTSLVVIPFEEINISEENRYWVSQFANHFPTVIARIPDIQIKRGFDGMTLSTLVSQNPPLVDYVLTGSVVQVNEQLRLNLELINAEDGMVSFSDKFDLGTEGLFDVQDQIAAHVVDTLSLYLDEDQRSTMLDWGTKNAAAYSHFLQAEFHALQLNNRDLDMAIDQYKLAIEDDSNFLNAHIGLANSAARKALISHVEAVPALADIVNTALREVIRLRADEKTMLPIQILALRVEGTNQTLIEQKLAELIRSGNAPEFAYAHYATYLTGVRMYDEAQQFLQLVKGNESFEVSPDANWNYHSRVETPMNLVSIKRQQLLNRPSHISVMSSLIRSAAFIGDFGLANRYLRLQLELDSDGPYSMLDQVVVSTLAGGSIEEGETMEREKLHDPNYNFSHGVKRFILGDVEGGIELWRNLTAAENRRLYNFIDNVEIFFPPAVSQDPRYLALLDEIGVGISWQRHLMERVKEMSGVTGVQLSAKSQAAYDANVFMSSNNLWEHDAMTYPRRTFIDNNRISSK